MAFELIKQLLEMELTAGNVHQFAGKEPKHLTDSNQYKELAKLDTEYAKKLVSAWTGDAKDFERTQGKNFDPLFPKMLDQKAIAKFAPGIKMTPDVEKAIKMLVQLFATSFVMTGKPAKQDNSVWKNVEWAREAQEQEAFNLLREEIESALAETQEG